MFKAGLLTILVMICATPATSSAQIPVTDVATTVRNAATAGTKELLARLQEQQHSELRRMAHRLSMFTDLVKYAMADVPRWRIHDFEDPNAFLFSRPYHAALNYGDAAGSAYQQVARARLADTVAAIAVLPPEARDVVERLLATVDLADSTIVADTHQTGSLRYNGRRELQAIDALEHHVIDPSQEQSTTAIADKISGAALIGARQRQARLQFLLGVVDQLLVDSKRARDAEVAAMNMQLGALRDARSAHPAWLDGTAEHLRTWRQP
jgi:hypothetical protein